MGNLTPRAQQVLDLLIEITYEDDTALFEDAIADVLFELLYDKLFEDAIYKALEKRGYEVRPIEIPD